jgi:hypothetical protein
MLRPWVQIPFCMLSNWGTTALNELVLIIVLQNQPKSERKKKMRKCIIPHSCLGILFLALKMQIIEIHFLVSNWF